MIVQAGSTDQTTYFVVRLTADGTAATGLTPADFDLQYTRSGAAAAAKVDATLNANGVGGAHSNSTVIEVDATSSPGLYRVDWVDAAFAAGVGEVILEITVATAFAEALRVELSPAVNAVALGGGEQSLADLKDFADTGYDPVNHIAQSDLVYIHGTSLSETSGQLAGRFSDFFDEASATFTLATALADFKASGFNTVVPPSVNQFNARTIVSDDYFVVTDYTAPDNTGIGAIETIVSSGTFGNAAILTRGNIAWTTGSGGGDITITDDNYTFRDT